MEDLLLFNGKKIGGEHKVIMLNIFAQSICTLYSCFENMGRFATQNKYFSKVPEPKKISGQPDELDIRVQIDWLKDLFIKCNFSKGRKCK